MNIRAYFTFPFVIPTPTPAPAAPCSQEYNKQANKQTNNQTKQTGICGRAGVWEVGWVLCKEQRTEHRNSEPEPMNPFSNLKLLGLGVCVSCFVVFLFLGAGCFRYTINIISKSTGLVDSASASASASSARRQVQVQVQVHSRISTTRICLFDCRLWYSILTLKCVTRTSKCRICTVHPSLEYAHLPSSCNFWMW